MNWFLGFLFLSLAYCSVSEANHDKKLPSAVVVGTVYCDTCFQQGLSTKGYLISGASVAVECEVGNSITSFKKEVKTNELGEFKVQLPFIVRNHAKIIKRCTFKIISSNDPQCVVASAATSSSMSLKTRKQGEHIFSAGLFSFRPIKEPNFCGQKQSVSNSKAQSLDKSQDDKNSVTNTFLPPIPFLPPLPQIPFLPPLPQIPFLPPLPPLPPIPFLPLPPLPPLPPIPFLPPLPPNPFLPPLPPNPFPPPNISPPALPLPPNPSPSGLPPLIPSRSTHQPHH